MHVYETKNRRIFPMKYNITIKTLQLKMYETFLVILMLVPFLKQYLNCLLILYSVFDGVDDL